MDADSFTNLALRVLAGEATLEERHAVETELAAYPARQEEFQQLNFTLAVFSASAPLVEAANATTPELPAYRSNELRTAVRQHFGPAINRRPARARSIFSVLRWITAGATATALTLFVVYFDLSQSSIEIGLYQSSLVRGDNSALTPQDVPGAYIVSFDQDAPFDQWQNRPLNWNQRAKIWVDNEHDLLHIVTRDARGNLVSRSEPLAPSDREQSAQIQRTVQALEK